MRAECNSFVEGRANYSKCHCSKFPNKPIKKKKKRNKTSAEDNIAAEIWLNAVFFEAQEKPYFSHLQTWQLN